MSIRDTVVVIHETLIKAKQGKTFASKTEQLAWERGFLTGVLARLAEDDSFVRIALKRLLEKQNNK